MFVRKALITDVMAIKSIIDAFALEGLILERSMDNIYKCIRDFTVCSLDSNIVGVSALTFFTEDFAEIRSLAVIKEHRENGIGTLLLNSCIKEALSYNIKSVFTLTYIPDYFKKRDFYVVDKKLLPHKIWRDCISCKHFYDCDEEAMVKELGSSL